MKERKGYVVEGQQVQLDFRVAADETVDDVGVHDEHTNIKYQETLQNGSIKKKDGTNYIDLTTDGDGYFEFPVDGYDSLLYYIPNPVDSAFTQESHETLVAAEFGTTGIM